MLKIKTYKNNFYRNRKNLHVQIPKRYHFPDDCLILTLVIKSRYVFLHDNGEIFKSIDQSGTRINPPVYCHGLNKYALSAGNNLQIIQSTDLANVIFTNQPTRDRIYQAVMDYIQFISKLYDSGIRFKYVY